MAENDIKGKVGDLSGHMGDLSGRSLQEVRRIILQDHLADEIKCLSRKVDRLDASVMSVASWLDARLRDLEERLRGAEGPPPN